LGFRYTLRLPDGSDAGEVEYPDGGVQAGDVIRIDDNQRMRVVAAVQVEIAAEFIDGAVYAVLEVEPVDRPS